MRIELTDLVVINHIGKRVYASTKPAERSQRVERFLLRYFRLIEQEQIEIRKIFSKEELFGITTCLSGYDEKVFSDKDYKWHGLILLMRDYEYFSDETKVVIVKKIQGLSSFQIAALWDLCIKSGAEPEIPDPSSTSKSISASASRKKTLAEKKEKKK